MRRESAAAYYSEYRPAPSLAHLVRCYWHFHVDASREEPYHHTVLPDACLSLIHAAVPGFPAYVATDGPRLEAMTMMAAPGLACNGVRFWPDVGRACVDAVQQLDAAQLLGARSDPRSRAPTRLQGGSPAPAWVGRCDAVLPEGLSDVEPDREVREAVRAIDAAPERARIDEVAAAVGLSPRQMLRRFKAAVGLTPKQYLRVRRLRFAVGNVLSTTPDAWTRVAADAGYADQAHMTREFAALLGMTPTRFQERAATIEHGTVSP